MRFLAGTLNIKLKECHMPMELQSSAQCFTFPFSVKSFLDDISVQIMHEELECCKLDDVFVTGSENKYCDLFSISSLRVIKFLLQGI